MIPVLIDAAMRSLFVGLIVAVGLRAFRVRNVVVQKAAWGLVLVGALTMPLLMPITERLQLLPARASIVVPAQAMTLLEELQARIASRGGSGRMTKPGILGPGTLGQATSGQGAANPVASNPVASPPAAIGPVAAATPAGPLSQAEKSSRPAPGAGSAPIVQEPGQPSTEATEAKARAVADNSRTGDEGRPIAQPKRAGVSSSVFHSISRSVTAISHSISLPVLAFSIYCAIAAVLLLRLALGLAVTVRLWITAAPIPTRELSELHTGLRLRASSRVASPLTIGSAILLPVDYETWDREKLRIVLAHERSHIRQGDFYLQVLAGLYSALVWFSPLGWWLRRELADLAEAISDRAGIEEARSRTSYAQILLEFAAAPRPTALGVAMARSSSLARRIERLLNDHAFRQSFAGGRRALVAVVLVPMALFAATAMVRVQAAMSSAPSAPVAVARVSAVAAPKLGSTTIHAPATATADMQLTAANTEASNIEPANAPDATANEADAPETEPAAMPTSEIASAEAAPSLMPLPAIARAVAAAGQDRDDMSFDRTLTVSGDPQLMVRTGSGNIHLTPASGNQIRIHGRIHVSRDGSEERARQIAANPPIEQAGNVVKVGQQHEEHWHGISIDYEIEAPAGTLLDASSGSGDVVDDGVGKNAKLETGSGDIRAKGLQGGFVVKTGSGNITAEETGQGEVKAETGSGNIEIKDIHGSFRAETGSGDIKASGTPSAPWNLQTGSGNIELLTGNAPITLDGSTGSGEVTTDHEMLVKGSLNQHHITGNLNGGGPLVRAETGSGDIRIH